MFVLNESRFEFQLLVLYILNIVFAASGNSINFHVKANCSRYEPLPDYDISEIRGLWNYVRLFTEERLLTNPDCLRVVNKVRKSTLSMNITIPDPRPEHKGHLLSSLAFGAVNSKTTGTGQWIFFSESPLAPSKWIILAQEERHALYLICGDFPDGTSAVGEIGVLSRKTQLSDEVAAGFQDILLSYDLNVTLRVIQHNQCPPLLLN